MNTTLWIVFLLCFIQTLEAAAAGVVQTGNDNTDPMHFLTMGDDALVSDDMERAITYYRKGIDLVTSFKSSSSSSSSQISPVVIVSLYTNLGTALSSIGENIEAADFYKKAVLIQQDAIELNRSNTNGDNNKKGEGGNYIMTEQDIQDCKNIAAQASFYLGMVQQELGNLNKAANAYAHASTLDPLHWGALANLGALLQDELRNPADAIDVYNKAYEILTQPDVEPTDAPAEPRYILSQLQYRIGMSILSTPDRKCALRDDPTTEVDCKELAANAFATAVQMDDQNEGAKHMLASVTADATVKRASNTYVEELFENYAENFEHSLVDDLKYDGYKRLRQEFSKAFGGEEQLIQQPFVPFPLVVDAGCGTGLVGEQFRTISSTLVGVDLSQAIIKEAKKKRPNLYDDTQVGDIVEIFKQRAPISLIVAADSYIYFGDLDPLFESMGNSITNDGNGYVAFTLENVSHDSEQSLQETKPDWRWQLTASGRFAHRKEYVETVGIKYGLQTIHYVPLEGFRYENGIPVRGHIFIMNKRRNEQKEEL